MVKKEQLFYKDLPLSFIFNPITKDVPFAKNEAAVKKALLNLLRTPVGTRPFRPDYGVNLSRYVFEPADYETEVNINKEIADAIRQFEQRVNLISIESTIVENLGVKVSISYYVLGIPQQQVLETTITTRVK